ncbi:hypothetical protein [Isoptericola sp. AK164]|uniref:DUF4231 domain-containing protein n=1 Tax=Isoptericola sp. AK164 TaxID=3024246 RepID=UPI00241898F0|nr:hypothetical protein [Isoptericola sp. AK164]
MDTSPAGLAALALFVLWLGYWVPLQLRRRTELAAARVDDRFSGGLRMLTVADGAGKGRPMPTNRAAGHSPPTGSTPRVTASAAGPASGMTPQVRASRLAVLERRAARARRRLTLTVLLTLLTAAAWTAVGLGYVPWPVAAVPSGLLLVVLVLGRLAVLTARRSDARWRSERRAEQQRATQRRTLAHGGPYAPRNRARVTGYAVHPSDTHTQMIPRVQQGTAAATGERREPTTAPSDRATGRAEDRADDGEPERRAPASPSEHSSAPSDDHDRSGQHGDGGSPEQAAEFAPGYSRHVGGEPWDPVPVPLPTYVTKPEAPRAGADADPTTPRTGGTSAPREGGRWTVEDRAEPQDSAYAAPSGAPEPAAGDEPRPRSETLGLPLEQILARRRAAG